MNFSFPALYRNIGLCSQIAHHPVMSWSADVTKGRWDRLLSPAKERCRTTSKAYITQEMMATFLEYNIFLFSLLNPFYMPSCEMKSLRGLPVPLTGKSECSNRSARQINCWNEVCWPPPSLLAFEASKQSGSWRKASCLAMGTDTSKLPNS